MSRGWQRKKKLKGVDECEVEGRRTFGYPRLQWENCVWGSAQMLGVKNWWIVASDGDK